MRCTDCGNELLKIRGLVWDCRLCGYSAVVSRNEILIGRCVTRADGRIVVQSADGVPLGYFNSATEMTYSMGNEPIAAGDRRLDLLLERSSR